MAQTSVVYYAQKMVVSDSSGADSRPVQDYRLDWPSPSKPVRLSVSLCASVPLESVFSLISVLFELICILLVLIGKVGSAIPSVV